MRGKQCVLRFLGHKFKLTGKTLENCKTRSLFKHVKDDSRSISSVNSHIRLIIPSCDVYRGQAVRDLPECLWGDRFLDVFDHDIIIAFIEGIYLSYKEFLSLGCVPTFSFICMYVCFVVVKLFIIMCAYVIMHVRLHHLHECK